ncbi:MAG TPA: hypothetical protein VGU01_11650 [Sphingomicrobium sp.]|nr:hypothetical protein [Sphingomicrobium sp.]
MHFHLPKPLHGWREFTGEVGIIVFGVLIALAAEQLVEAVHWREGVGQMRAAMRSELAVDRARLESNLAQDPCMRARLHAILGWVASAPTNAHIVDAGGPSLWNYHSSTWDINKASPIAAHFSLREQLMYAAAYDSVVNEQRYLLDEQKNWAEMIATLSSGDRPESRGQLEHDVAIAKIQLDDRESNSRFFVRHLDDLGITADPRGTPRATDVHRLCAPL